MKMNLKRLAGFFIGSYFFLLWCNKLLLSSDIPVTISYQEMQDFLLTMMISVLVTLAYIKWVNETNMHYFIAFPTLLWSVSTIQALTYHYHPYDTLLVCAGFAGCLLIIFSAIVKKNRNTVVS